MKSLIIGLYRIALIAVLSSVILLGARIADALTITGNATYSTKYDYLNNGHYSYWSMDSTFSPESFTMSVGVDGVSSTGEYSDGITYMVKYSRPTSVSISDSPFTNALQAGLGLNITNYIDYYQASFELPYFNSNYYGTILRQGQHYDDFIYNIDGSLRSYTDSGYFYGVLGFQVPAAYASWSDVSYLTLDDYANDLNKYIANGNTLSIVEYSYKYYYDASCQYTNVSGIRYEGTFIPTSLPEPSTLLLFGSGLVGLELLRRRFKA